MNRNYTYFNKDKDKQHNIASMTKYSKNKQELDKLLEKLITPLIKEKELKILDACCGVGHIIGLLNEISPKSIFLGVDQTAYLIEEAKSLYKNQKNISFQTEDVYNLPQKLIKEFDISINWKTLSWLPYYDQLLKSLFAVTKKTYFYKQFIL